jgi:hypothetical protein
MLAALQAAGAVFVVVGAHAMAVHGVPRATGDLDIWVRPDLENAPKVLRALVEFGAPLEAMNVREEDLTKPGTVYQIGLPPRRVDIITDIDGVEFEEAWRSKVISRIADLAVPFLGWDALLQNKEAAGRPKDVADLKLLKKKNTAKY